MKFGGENWSVPAWLVSVIQNNVPDSYLNEEKEKSNTPISGAFFRAVEDVILNPRRETPYTLKRMDIKSNFLNMFCRHYLPDKQW